MSFESFVIKLDLTMQQDWRLLIKKLCRLCLFVIARSMIVYWKLSIYHKALNIWSLEKLGSFVFPRVLMSPPFRLGKHQDSLENKIISLGTIH